MNMYNGHPSYEHWNVTLWMANCESLYRFIRGGCSSEDLREIYPVTGDGVELTDELAQYAINRLAEDIEEVQS